MSPLPCRPSRRLSTRRWTTIAGILLALSTSTAIAQAPAQADRNGWSNDSAKPSELAPPARAEQNRPRQPSTPPPARRDDEFDPPPAGCQYRGNKLDLLV